MKDKFYKFLNFVSEYALYGLLFFIPISISLVEIFAALMLFGFVGRKIIKPNFMFVKFWPNILLLLFLFFSALSLLNSAPYINKSLHALFGKWMQYLGICIITQDIIYDRKIMKRAVFIFLSSAYLVVLSGLSQYFFGVEFLRNRNIFVMPNGTRAITSCFAHYNGFGSYLVIVLSLVSVLLLRNNRFGFQAVSLLIFAMFSATAFLLTFSRGSWLSLAVSVIFMAIFMRKNLKLLILIFLAVITMLLFPVLRERLLLAFKVGGDSDRFKYWLVAFKMINEHPFFGMGVGTFMANFIRYQPHLYLSYAHNCYLQIWAETGIFALVSFLIFIVSVVYLGIKKFLVSKDFLLLGLLSGIVGFLIHSFLDTDLYSLQLAFLFWVWIGLIAARVRMVYDE